MITLLLIPYLTWAASVNNLITIAADPWCPYTCDPQSNEPGLMIEIARESLPDYEIHYERINWARAKKEAREGHYDAIAGAFKDDAPDFIFPNPMVQGAICFFSLPKNKWKYENLKSLKDITLGVVKDYSYGPSLDPYVDTHKRDPKKTDFVSGTSTINLLIKKLIAGRISAFVEDPSVVSYYLGHQGSSWATQIKNAGCLKEKENLYILFSPTKKPQAEQWIAALNRGMERLRVSGRLEQIKKKYMFKN